MDTVDDASGQTQVRLEKEEMIWVAVGLLRAGLKDMGYRVCSKPVGTMCINAKQRPLNSCGARRHHAVWAQVQTGHSHPGGRFPLGEYLEREYLAETAVSPEWRPQRRIITAASQVPVNYERFSF
jgi:hypothetical protein